MGEIELTDDECIVLNIFTEGQFVGSRPLHELRLYAGTATRQKEGTSALWAAPLQDPRTVRLQQAVQSLVSKGLLHVEALERRAGETYLDWSNAVRLEPSEAEEFLANDENWWTHYEGVENRPVLYEVAPADGAEAAYVAAMEKRGLTADEGWPEEWTIR